MMRLILAAFALTALALPAHAQRLDTRVREVTTDAGGTKCRLNANPGMLLVNAAAGAEPQALLDQPPIDAVRGFHVLLGMTFQPRPATRFNSGPSVLGLELIPIGRTRTRKVSHGRLLIDGEDSGVKLILQVNPDRPRATYLAVPEALRLQTAERILRSRSVDFEVTDGVGTVTHYRFDGLRIADAAEILSIIKFSCNTYRAD
ncbi:hypothetical protein OF829_10495 [Sphingomonas sp. LB-2]|uniref:hypothetical protein n=1 Tax=Sphingomonas caeni TaxID=2984949 RepID=UPI00222E7606|nr:hypothetical protein [Sphingomonas caeni]MCW3847671.1 hypothetical protein [Sphingomonas caeni]